jgi:hypothetical protein
MRQTGLEPLAPEIESLLSKERDIERQSAESRARGMARARAALREIPASSWNPWRQRATFLVAAALLTAVAAAAVAALRKQPPAADERSSTLSHASDSRARVAPPPVATTEPVPDAPKNDVRPAPPEKSPIVPASRSTPSNPDALELGLLQRVRADVARGDFAAALDAIGEHERRFPAGRLREEREALRVKALSGLGKKDEARAAAQKFKSRFPRSVLSASIEEATRPRP